MELLTAAQMREKERRVIDSGAAAGLDLMERAGAGVVRSLLTEWPALATGARSALVLCGPGNNGGDGFVIARLLVERGWTVRVFLYGDAEKLPPDARVNHDHWLNLGTVEPLSTKTWEAEGFPGAYDLLIDALFGIGLSRPVDLPLGCLMADVDAGQTSRIVSVDLPSGLCSDSGRVIGDEGGVVAADLTVSFHRPKLGHHLDNGPALCGKLVICDIGLEDTHPGTGALLDPEVTELVSPPKAAWLAKRAGHKFSYGHALLVSGGPGRTGAARLAARGALRIGAGLVTLGVPPAAQMEVACQITALMLARVPDDTALTDLLQDRRINAICLGPALGIDDRAATLIETVLDHRIPSVLDADALTVIAQHPPLLAKLHADCVLTPHGGEFARLFPELSHQLNAPATTGPATSKVAATCQAAVRAGCIVLFKGPDTVIATPDGNSSIHSAAYERTAPWLATAGSGDVLAGFITGLMARGFAPVKAAEIAAWLHTEAARSFGPGLIAEDLPEELPKVLRSLGCAQD